MNERASSAAASAEAFGEHGQDRREILSRQRPVGPGPADQPIELVLAPFLRGRFGNYMLRQHVERLFGDHQPVELAAANAVDEGGTFDELVARQREQPPFGCPGDRMARAPDALQEAGDRARRAQLADQVDLANVDAELERGGRDQRFQRAAFEPLLGVEPLLPREAPVVRRHLLGSEPLGELAGHPLGEPAGVHKDQGRAVGFDQLRQAVVDLLPHFARHHRLERRGGNFEGEVARPAVAGVDDLTLSGRADEETGHCLDRLLRRRKPDAQQPAAAECGQPFERNRQMRTALVRRDGMDFVDNDRAGRCQHFAAGLRAEQDVERLRRRHDDMRRRAAHAFAFPGRRVAGAHPGADFDLRQPLPAQRLANAGERRFEIALDVVGKRL
jgi:hypothetical protein